MSNTRFILTNYVEAGTIMNGSGGGAPALDETSPFLMTRTQNGDRRSLWKTSSGGTTFTYDIDLGGARTIDVAALLAFNTFPSEDDGIFIEVSYATSYYPSAWTVFSVLGATASWTRDVGLVEANAITARYWRFVIVTTSSTSITCGRVLLGRTTAYNLGGIHSPGGVSSPFQNRVEQVMEDGSFNTNTLGYSGRDFTLPFNKVTITTRNKLMEIAAASGSVILVDAEDKVYEVLVTGGRCQVSRQTDALFDVALECKRLP